MHMEIERSFLSIVFKNLERFIQRGSKYEDLDELTLTLCGACQGVCMKAPDRTGGKRGPGHPAISMALRALSPWKS